MLFASLGSTNKSATFYLFSSYLTLVLSPPSYRRDGVVVRASASQSVTRGSIPLSSHTKRFFKKWYSQLPCWALSKTGIVWRTIRQAHLLCPWARHLTGCLRFCVAGRWWGQAVYPSLWPSLTKGMQTEHELIRMNE